MSDRILYACCPLCDSLMHELQQVADCTNYPNYDSRLSSKMVWRICLNCRHSFTEGFYTIEAANIIFSKTHESQKVGANLEVNRVSPTKR